MLSVLMIMNQFAPINNCGAIPNTKLTKYLARENVQIPLVADEIAPDAEVDENLLPQEMDRIHTIRVGADYLGEFAGRLIRFRVSAVPAADRAGMDTPVFSFLMWGNEHLKLAEDAINAAAGRLCRWVLDEQVNEQTGAVTARWKYVPRDQTGAIPGDIAIQERAIAAITARTDSEICTVPHL